MSNEPITITDTATPYLNFIAETKPGIKVYRLDDAKGN